MVSRILPDDFFIFIGQFFRGTVKLLTVFFQRCIPLILRLVAVKTAYRKFRRPGFDRLRLRLRKILRLFSFPEGLCFPDFLRGYGLFLVLGFFPEKI